MSSAVPKDAITKRIRAWLREGRTWEEIADRFEREWPSLASVVTVSGLAMLVGFAADGKPGLAIDLCPECGSLWWPSVDGGHKCPNCGHIEARREQEEVIDHAEPCAQA